jgi:hypothetical protein
VRTPFRATLRSSVVSYSALLLMNALRCRDLSGQNLTGPLPSSITRLRVLNTMCAHPVCCWLRGRCNCVLAVGVQRNVLHTTSAMQHRACKTENGHCRACTCWDSLEVARPGNLPCLISPWLSPWDHSLCAVSRVDRVCESVWVRACACACACARMCICVRTYMHMRVWICVLVRACVRA